MPQEGELSFCYVVRIQLTVQKRMSMSTELMQRCDADTAVVHAYRTCKHRCLELR